MEIKTKERIYTNSAYKFQLNTWLSVRICYQLTSEKILNMNNPRIRK